jgi:hypothetical protein
MQPPQKKPGDLIGMLCILAVGATFAVATVVALCTGHVKERSGDFTAARDPSSFWGWIAFYVFAAAFAFYAVIKLLRRRG